MTTKTKTKIASRDQLIKASRRAKRRGLNRQLTSDQIRKLDPSGINVFQLVMIHEHAGGVAVEPHFRCFAFLKLRGKDAPLKTMLDIPAEDYKAWAE